LASQADDLAADLDRHPAAADPDHAESIADLVAREANPVVEASR
jgi:hypothetical protein